MRLTEYIPLRKLIWVSLFAIAFGFVESSVVVYLRAIYYPEGFTLPLKVISNEHLTVELLREAATIIMLAAIGIIAGRKCWQRFGYFCIAFGVWDIFYYIWLKVVLDWPASLADWDVLFLIPLPWIGPVISAGLVALLMTIIGVDLVIRTTQEKYFRPNVASWVCAIFATAALLYSFMYDTDATIRGNMPLPYRYDLLVFGLIGYGAGYAVASRKHRGAEFAV